MAARAMCAWHFLSRLGRGTVILRTKSHEIKYFRLHYACLSTEGTIGANGTYRDNWPCRRYWKQFDFSAYNLQKLKLNLEGSDTSFNKLMMASIVTGRLINRIPFYYLMSLKDSTTPWQENEGVVVLKLLSCSHVCMSKKEKVDWIEYLVKELENQGAMTLKCYNALLKCYINLNLQFDPIEILSRLRKVNVKPDQTLFIYLLQRYVYSRDMDSAWNIFEYVEKETGKPLLKMKSVMLTGCAMAGIDDRAKEMEKSIRNECGQNVGMQLQFIQEPLILASALTGNIEQLKNFVIQMGQDRFLRTQFYIEAIETCSYNGAREGASFLINALGKISPNLYNSIASPMTSLVINGYYDLACQMFLNLDDPHALKFFLTAAAGDMPPEEAAKYAVEFQNRGIRNAHFEEYLARVMLHSPSSERLKQCYPVMKKFGIEIRPCYFWKVFSLMDTEGNLQDILDILPYYKLDGVTEDLFLFPCLKKLNVTTTEFLKYLIDSENLSADDCLYLQLNYALFLGETNQAKKILDHGIALKSVSVTQEELDHCHRKLNEKLTGSFPMFSNRANRPDPQVSYLNRDLASKAFASSPKPGVHKSIDVVLSESKKKTSLGSQSDEIYKRILGKEMVRRDEALVVVTELVQNRRPEDARRCLLQCKIATMEHGLDTDFKCELFDMPVTAKNIQLATDMFKILLRRGYLSTGWIDSLRSLQIRFVISIVRNYFQFILKSGDEKKVIATLKELSTMNDLKNMSIYVLLPLLIEENKVTIMKKVLTYISQNGWYNDHIALNMAIGFFEKGDDVKAQQALQKTFISERSSIRLFNLLAAEGRHDIMRKLSASLTLSTETKDSMTDLTKETKATQEEAEDKTSQKMDFYKKQIRNQFNKSKG